MEIKELIQVNFQQPKDMNFNGKTHPVPIIIAESRPTQGTFS